MSKVITILLIISWLSLPIFAQHEHHQPQKKESTQSKQRKASTKKNAARQRQTDTIPSHDRHKIADSAMKRDDMNLSGFNENE